MLNKIRTGREEGREKEWVEYVQSYPSIYLNAPVFYPGRTLRSNSLAINLSFLSGILIQHADSF